MKPIMKMSALCLGVCIWKIATETLYLAAGAPLWEVVERGGSYAAPLALALLLWSGQRNWRDSTAAANGRLR